MSIIITLTRASATACYWYTPRPMTPIDTPLEGPRCKARAHARGVFTAMPMLARFVVPIQPQLDNLGLVRR